MKYAKLLLLPFIMASCVASPKAPPIISEKDYYKAMYEQAAATAASSTSTTYTTLGIVVTIFATIIVLQFLFNIRVSKQKIRELELRLAASQGETLERNERDLRQLISGAADTTLQLDAKRIDAIKADITQLRIILLHVAAEFYVFANRQHMPFYQFLKMARMEIQEGNLNNEFLEMSLRTFNNIETIYEPDFLELKRIYTLYSKKNPPPGVLDMFGSLIKNLKVMKVIPNSRPLNAGVTSDIEVEVRNDFKYE